MDEGDFGPGAVGEAGTRRISFAPNRRYPSNSVNHRKYNVFNLIPKFLFLQFRFFFNFFYLAITVTQLIPEFRIGFLITYVGPLMFVLLVSLVKELVDEFQRWKRDRELNLQKYKVLSADGVTLMASQSLCVGHVIEIEAGERVPADLILLKTSDEIGSTFIKTTQLDGETDWKLRRSIPAMQSSENIFDLDVEFEVEAPRAEIYDFAGKVIINGQTHAIGVESTIWCDASVASGSAIGVVAYTGKDTRSAMNATPAPVKVGIFDIELNRYSSVLFALLFLASFLASSLNGFGGNFHILLVRFVLLFSFIIPISMRCNLDVSRLFYSVNTGNDMCIEGAIMRNSSIPEELGRVQFVFTDKTGTLTKNEMEFRKLQIDNIVFTDQSDDAHFFSFLALALCHCVTVTRDGFQASSPDEVALVKHAAEIGFRLLDRSDTEMTLEIKGQRVTFEILALLPFSSVWRSMGILVRNSTYGNLLICKGADSAISSMVLPNEWLMEVVGNLAREGLRTLVYAYRKLNDTETSAFMTQYREASTSVIDRSGKILSVFQSASHSMELLGVTGVEDKLQDSVAETLEALAAANMKVWMLTGDKLETAICVALSSRLFCREEEYLVLKSYEELSVYANSNPRRVPPLVIDGTAMQQALVAAPKAFVEFALRAPAITVCRCSPSQKESVVKTVRSHSSVVTCAVGDGGNDVSMIQAASIGIGIVGREGKQASLAADVSINTFAHLQRLLLWHGSNYYKHSSRLAQFVMHRGVIMTVTQAIYSLLFNFVPAPLYNDWLMMGFATFFTMFPVFSLIFDEFIESTTVMAFPELYHKCQKGRYLSAKTFIGWTWLAVYQGSVIVFLSIALFGSKAVESRHLQSTAFTSLVLTELLLIAMNINKFNWISVTSEVCSVLMYLISMVVLSDAFDMNFIFSWSFAWRILLVTTVAVVPQAIYELLSRMFSPSHEERLRKSSSLEVLRFVIL